MGTQNFNDYLRNTICAWYPEYKTRTYFVPPVIITRIPFDEKIVAGETILVPTCLSTQASSGQYATTYCNAAGPVQSTQHSQQSRTITNTIGNLAGRMWNAVNLIFRVQESDQRDDLAQQQVLFCLRELARQRSEVMFVLSQLKFSDYLGNKSYSRDVKRSRLPMGNKSRKRIQQGDFDILVIHRHYGIMAGEIKAIQAKQEFLNKSQEDVDQEVKARVIKAIGQLDKSEKNLKKMTSDLAPNLAIRKTLILPYVTKMDIRRVLKADGNVKQNLIHCLGAKDVDQAIGLCLLADNLNTMCDTPWSVQQIETWWEKRISNKHDPVMTEDVYLNLIARFCGPATSISVHFVTKPRLEARTEGEGVSAVGERMMQLVLTPEQINLLTVAPRKVFLHGPPGTGKSLALALMAIKWVKDGNSVCFVSLHHSSSAVSHLIKKQVEITAQSPKSLTVFHYSFIRNGLSDYSKAVNDVRMEAAKVAELLIILDELTSRNVKEMILLFFYFRELCKHSNISSWAASSFHRFIPLGFEVVAMTIPLRSPPVVKQEVEKIYSWYSDSQLEEYSKTCLVAPCDGPNVLMLKHEGMEHTERWPADCVECGKAIGDVLKQLGVGFANQSSGAAARGTTGAVAKINRNISTGDIGSVPPLEYRDVFVLSSTSSFCENSGVLRGLRDQGMPVRICMDAEMEDTAVAKDDVITACHYLRVSGLERKIVVLLPYKNLKHSDRESCIYDRFHGMSRCTAQLILVDMPLSYYS